MNSDQQWDLGHKFHLIRNLSVEEPEFQYCCSQSDSNSIHFTSNLNTLTTEFRYKQR